MEDNPVKTTPKKTTPLLRKCYVRLTRLEENYEKLSNNSDQVQAQTQYQRTESEKNPDNKVKIMKEQQIKKKVVLRPPTKNDNPKLKNTTTKTLRTTRKNKLELSL